MIRIMVNLPDSYNDVIKAEMDKKGYRSAAALIKHALDRYFQSSEAATHPNWAVGDYIGRSTVNERYERLQVQADNLKRIDTTTLAMVSAIAKAVGISDDDLQRMVDEAMPLAGKRMVLPQNITALVSKQTTALVPKTSKPDPVLASQLAPTPVSAEEDLSDESKTDMPDEPEVTDSQTTISGLPESQPYDSVPDDESPSLDFIHAQVPEPPVQDVNVQHNAQTISPADAAGAGGARLTINDFNPDMLAPKYQRLYKQFTSTNYSLNDASTMIKELVFLDTMHTTPGMDQYASQDNLFAADGSVNQDVAQLIADEESIASDADARANGHAELSNSEVTAKLAKWCDADGRFIDPRL